MVAFKGHFDGKVIVPDEPLALQPNQRLIVHVEPVAERTTDFREWIGLATKQPLNPSPKFRRDADVWE